MPSVKIPRKSTDFDMTPFVDVAFLILSFFMLVTKFKPPEPVEITTPNSVSTIKLPDDDAILVEIAPDGRIFFSMRAESKPELKYKVIENLNKTRNLGLTEAQMQTYVRSHSIGVPFSQLKGLLSRPVDTHKDVAQPGIPVQDSASNELYYWVRDAISAFQGNRINYLIKGDNAAKFPAFKQVLEAFARNDQNKFQLVTSPESAPVGTALYIEREGGKPTPK
jgi:biopolymer transport protein ExbD